MSDDPIRDFLMLIVTRGDSTSAKITSGLASVAVLFGLVIHVKYTILPDTWVPWLVAFLFYHLIMGVVTAAVEVKIPKGKSLKCHYCKGPIAPTNFKCKRCGKKQ